MDCDCKDREVVARDEAAGTRVERCRACGRRHHSLDAEAGQLGALFGGERLKLVVGSKVRVETV